MAQPDYDQIKTFFSKLNTVDKQSVKNSAHLFLQARVQNLNNATPTNEGIDYEINLAYKYAIQLYKFNEKLNSGL